MKKFSLVSVLTLSAVIKCAAVEDTFNSESITVSTPESRNLQDQQMGNLTPPTFRKYVSIEIAGLSKLHARFNFGFRKELGLIGYDLGVFGSTGKSTSTCGGYSSCLYYFNPGSNFKFYSGLGFDAGSLWGKHSYGFFSRGMLSAGLSHIARSGRNDFFQINLNWPEARYEKVYENRLKKFGGNTSISKISWDVLGINVFYGLFF